MNQGNLSLYDRIGGRDGISILLRHFYADVRQHRLIGPVFNERIKDWPAHLAKIGEFWARVTGGPSSYSGQMPAKHLTLGLDPRHFASMAGVMGFKLSLLSKAARSSRDERRGA